MKSDEDYVASHRKFFAYDPSFVESLSGSGKSLIDSWVAWLDHLEEVNQREYQAVATTVSNMAGRFALQLRPGKYIFVGTGKLKYEETLAKHSFETLGDAAWVREVTIQDNATVVLSEPVCEPKPWR